MESIRTRGLSASGLKWIALILMVLDHIHYFFAYTGRVPEWFSMAGRLAAPLFLFCLVEGFSHTHDRRRYFMKVYAIHLLMSGLLLLMLCGLLPIRPDGFYPMNGMMTSFAILMVVFQGIDWLGEKRWGPGLAAVVLPLAWPVLASMLMGMAPALQMPLSVLGYTFLPMWNSNPDAGIGTILTGILLYGFRKNRRVQAGVFAGFTVLYYFLYPLLVFSQSPEFHWTMMFTTAYEWYGALAALLMLCYNGERGRGPKAFFYAFYPAHVYILYALSWAAYPLLAGG
ncbi:TraX family protein [uncultured Oscillibacter sp.]|uniref:TraX family protein n=1 Tax=uncultured Oscillibacter sp. TaxID=876091 RepID=UPI002613BD0A|nr:TraX family protein [uncultured Oscillibacter sp.]